MKKLLMVLSLVILMWGCSRFVSAQGRDPGAVITPENAAEVETLARWGRGAVSTLAWSPDGSTLAVGGGAGIWLYRTEDFAADPVLLEGHTGWVNSLVYSADGRELVFRDQDGPIRIWDAQTAHEQLVVPLPRDAQYGGDLMVALSPDEQTLFSGGAGEEVGLWNARTGQKIARLDEDFGWAILSATFSPDSKRLVTGSYAGGLQMWDAGSGELVDYVTGESSSFRNDTVESVAFDTAGTRLVFGRGDGEVSLWNLTTDEITTLGYHDCPDAEWKTIEAYTCSIYSLDFSPDGSLVASAGQDGTVKLWDVGSGFLWRVLDGRSGWVQDAAFSPDGTRLATLDTDNTVRLWNPATGDLLTALDDFSDAATSLAFSPDGRSLVFGGSRGTVAQWEVSTGAPLRTLESASSHWIGSLRFSLDGAALAVGQDNGALQVWNTATWQVSSLLESMSTRVNGVAYSPDGSLLAAGGCRTYDYLCEGARLWVWELPDYAATVWDQPSVREISSVSFSPDGGWLATGEADDDAGSIRFWNTTAWTAPKELEDPAEVLSVAFSPDGQRLASASRDRTIRVWDAGTGHVLLTLTGHASTIWRVAFHPTGTLLASSDLDGMIRLWDASTGQSLAVLDEHSAVVWDVAFSPDGTLLASASSDGTVRLWGVP